MKSIEINEQEYQGILAHINEMPTKYGVPLLNFFGQKFAQAEQAQEKAE